MGCAKSKIWCNLFHLAHGDDPLQLLCLSQEWQGLSPQGTTMKMELCCPVPHSPSLYFPSAGHKCSCWAKHGAEQLPVTPWVPGWGFLGGSFPLRPYKHSRFSSATLEPGPTGTAAMGFNFERTCTQPGFPHTNLSSSQP